MGFLGRHLKHAIRQLRRQPGLALTVIITLGLAVGANTAIFSFVNALLIRPFPFRDADQLVEIRSVRGGQLGKLSMLEVLEIKEQVSILEDIAAHSGGAGGYNYSGSGDGTPEEWRAVLTTGNLFEVLGVRFEVGGPWPSRVDRERDDRVILTNGVWQRSFAMQRDVVGSRITLDHAPGYTIDGALPPGFDFPRGIEVYRSIGGFTSYDKRDSRNVVGIGRIRRPHGIVRLQAELNAVARRWAERFPGTNAGLSLQAVPFRELYSGDARPYLLVLLGAVGFVLLIACSNVANLLLARGLSRYRETAVRIALGAGRREIIGQLLAESVVLSALAGCAGLALAWVWMRALRAMIGAQLPAWLSVELDGRVLMFTLAVSVFAGIASGLAPAVQLFRKADVGESLKQGGRSSSAGRAAGFLRDLMAMSQVALAVMLVAGAILLVRAFTDLQEQERGFRTDRISTFRVALGWKRYGGDAIWRYYERAQRELSEMPGIEAVAFAPSPPLSRQEEFPATVQLESQSVVDAMRNPYIHYQPISENYFGVMQIPLKAGRFFTQFDRKETDQVAILSERLAKLLWPSGDAIGRRLRYNPAAANPSPLRTVVGIVGSVQHNELGGEPSLDVYVPYRQANAANQYMLVRHRFASEAEFTAKAERSMHSIDHEQSVFNFVPYEQRVLDSVWQLRVSRLLLIVFGIVALSLAAIGVYGVTSYLVDQRQQEIGIRLALGATPMAVQAIVLKRGMVMGAIGVGAGLAGAFVLGRVLEGLLHGVRSGDIVSLGLTAAILLLATLAANSIPALRASRLDPVIVLRRG